MSENKLNDIIGTSLEKIRALADGETVIGKGAVIGGNCFLTESVGAGVRVSAKPPELIYKGVNHE